MFLRDFWGIFSFCMNRNTLDIGKKLLETVRGVRKLSLLLLHPWRFYPFWVGEDDELRNWRQRCEWKVQLEHEVIVKNFGRWIASTLWF